MIRFTFLGVPIEIQPFFWLSLMLLGGAINADSAESILKVGLFMIAGFCSILIHELGHALSARAFGAFVEIRLEAFGGYASYRGKSMNRWQSFCITAAGPVVQILLGVLAFYTVPFFELNENMTFFFERLILISISWALLNLLPVLPLDGGQLMNAILGPKRVRLTLYLSLVVAVLSAVAMFVYLKAIFFPMFMGMFAWQAFQALKQIR